MHHLPWYVSAIGAALAWGLHYPLVDHALRRVSMMTVLLLTALPILLLVPFFSPDLMRDAQALQKMAGADRWRILALAGTSLAGTVLLYLSIGSKNATLASLIEISYPLFVVLFAYLLFSQWHVNTSVLIGAVLIFAGVGLIIANNP